MGLLCAGRSEQPQGFRIVAGLLLISAAVWHTKAFAPFASDPGFLVIPLTPFALGLGPNVLRTLDAVGWFHAQPVLKAPPLGWASQHACEHGRIRGSILTILSAGLVPVAILCMPHVLLSSVPA